MARPESVTPIAFDEIAPGTKVLTQYQRVEGKLIARGRGFSPCIVEETFPENHRLRVRFVYSGGRHEVCIIGETNCQWYHIHSRDGRHYDMLGVFRLEGRRLSNFESLLREHAAHCHDCKRLLTESRGPH